MLFFITGNEGKVKEVRSVIPYVETLNIDLMEIQSLSPQEVIEAKVKQAFAHHPGPFIVEDTSLSIEGLNGLPGTLTKWFEQSLGLNGIYRQAKSSGNTRAEVKTIIGYAESSEDIRYFDASVEGEIVAPRGSKGFGFDAIFQPEGYDKTFAEMEDAERYPLKMRVQAAKKLREALDG